MAEWKPELEVSEELARGLLARQIPELPIHLIAVFLSAALASYGHQEGLTDVTREALWALRQTAA